jgi:hypothetical protein
MGFLPRRSLTLAIELTPEEALARLAENVEVSRPSLLLRLTGGPKPKPFLGQVDGNTFTLMRIIRYRNSFQPLIRGAIEPRSSGSAVRLTMNINPLTGFVIGLWIVASLVIGVVGLFIHDNAAGRMIPFYMAVFGYLVCMGPFAIEAYLGKRALLRIFCAGVGEPGGGRP